MLCTLVFLEREHALSLLDEQEPVPEGSEPGAIGVCGAIPHADEGERAAERAQVAQGIQRTGLAGSGRRTVENAAPRLSALGGRVPAISPVERGELLRGDGRCMHFIICAGQGLQGHSSVVILDGRTLQSSVENGARGGYDGYKRRKGSKVYMAVGLLPPAPKAYKHCDC